METKIDQIKIEMLVKVILVITVFVLCTLVGNYLFCRHIAKKEELRSASVIPTEVNQSPNITHEKTNENSATKSDMGKFND